MLRVQLDGKDLIRPIRISRKGRGSDWIAVGEHSTHSDSNKATAYMTVLAVELHQLTAYDRERGKQRTR